MEYHVDDYAHGVTEFSVIRSPSTIRCLVVQTEHFFFVKMCRRRRHADGQAAQFAHMS